MTLMHLIMNLKTDSGRATFDSVLLCSALVSLGFGSHLQVYTVSGFNLKHIMALVVFFLSIIGVILL